MGWPKGVKKSQTGKAEVEQPKIQDHEVKMPEVEVPAAKQEIEHPLSAKRTCRACGHPDTIHYQGRDRQCNTSGCRCFRLTH